MSTSKAIGYVFLWVVGCFGVSAEAATGFHLHAQCPLLIALQAGNLTAPSIVRSIVPSIVTQIRQFQSSALVQNGYLPIPHTNYYRKADRIVHLDGAYQNTSFTILENILRRTEGENILLGVRNSKQGGSGGIEWITQTIGGGKNHSYEIPGWFSYLVPLEDAIEKKLVSKDLEDFKDFKLSRDHLMQLGFVPHESNNKLLTRKDVAGKYLVEFAALETVPEFFEIFRVTASAVKHTPGTPFQHPDSGFALFSHLEAERIQAAGYSSDELHKLYQTALLLSLSEDVDSLQSTRLQNLREATQIDLDGSAVLNRLAFDIIGGLLPDPVKESMLGRAAVLAKTGVPSPHIRHDVISGDLDDFHDLLRGFGVRLLSRSHPTFTQPEFLLDMLRYSGGRGTGTVEADSSLLNRFGASWKAFFGDNAIPLAFTQTGSDANALIMDVLAFLGKTSGRGPLELAVFEHSYGAGRGNLSGAMAFQLTQNSARSENSWGVTLREVPYIYKDEQTLSLQEVQEVTAREDHFLANFAELLKTRKIGGVMLETMAGRFFSYDEKQLDSRWLTFRQSFLLRLREFCDENSISIFVDDIMNVSRTGRVFSWEHFPGFEPDFFTFGKGLYVSGLAQFVRSNTPSESVFNITRPYHDIGLSTPRGHLKLFSVTNYAFPAVLLESMQVMDAIRTENLLERSERVGKYLMQRLRSYCDEVQGKGSHIMVNRCRFGTMAIANSNVRFNRILLPLDFAEEQVDLLFQ